MNKPRFSGPDAPRARLRATFATLKSDISYLPGQVTNEHSGRPLNSVITSFPDLVKQLVLGPEFEMRQCPICSYIGIREATLCGDCWTKLMQLYEADATHRALCSAVS